MKVNNFEVYKSFLENKYAKTMHGGVIPQGQLYVTEYVRKYATEEALREQEQQGVSSDSESSMSDFSEDETKDMEL